MNKITFYRSLVLLLLSVSFALVSKAQVYNGNLFLSTQAQVDAFSCTEVTGYLIISEFFSGSITNLDGLSTLTSVGGYLSITDNSSLTNLDALASITSIGGTLSITNNSSLTNLDGLASITSVGGYLYVIGNTLLSEFCGLYPLLNGGGLSGPYIVSNNASNPTQQEIIDGGPCPVVCPGDVFLTSQADVDAFTCNEVTGNLIISGSSITDLSPLSSLNYVGGNLSIGSNSSLFYLDGLSSLTTVEGSLIITSNSDLANLNGLASLTSVGGSVAIGACLSLTNLDGLASLTSVGGSVAIGACYSLTNLDGLASIASVGGYLNINHNPALINLEGLASLTSVGGYLSLLENNALINLEGLASLTSVGGDLSIKYNGSLTNLDGLSTLTSVGESLFIQNNGSLTSLDGLSALTSVGENLYILFNSSLSEFCGLYPLLNGGGLAGSYNVYGNASNPTQQDIIDAGPCNEPPVAECKDITISADASCQGTATASDVDNGSYDPDGDPITLSLSPEGPYALGDTEVTLTVTDDSGLSDACTATITVVDDTSPTLTAVSTPITLWPPNHKYETVTMDQLFVSVSDNCATLTMDDVFIESVSSDEPDNSDNDGNTTDDILFAGDDCSSVQLRRERDEYGNGRVYTINLAVNDGNGNTGTASVEVHVPIGYDQSSTDDGADHTETCTDTKSSIVANGNPNEVQLVNYPNPFNNKTTIAFTLPQSGKTTLWVYNSVGYRVATLFEGYAEAGQQYNVDFNGSSLAKGIYIYQLQTENGTQLMKKMVLMK